MKCAAVDPVKVLKMTSMARLVDVNQRLLVVGKTREPHVLTPIHFDILGGA